MTIATDIKGSVRSKILEALHVADGEAREALAQTKKLMRDDRPKVGEFDPSRHATSQQCDILEAKVEAIKQSICALNNLAVANQNAVALGALVELRVTDKTGKPTQETCFIAPPLGKTLFGVEVDGKNILLITRLNKIGLTAMATVSAVTSLVDMESGA